MNFFSKELSPYRRKQRLSRLLGVVAILSILIAWGVGLYLAKADLMPAVRQAIPQAGKFEQKSSDVYAAYASGSGEELIGYVALGEASGYGGPMTVAVAVYPSGDIRKVVIADHRETPAWMKDIKNSDFLTSLTGKEYSDAFQVGEDVDAVTGATTSSKAIAQAVLTGSRKAAQVMGLAVEAPPAPRVQFGIPEVTVILLFGVGFFAHQRRFKRKKLVRWGSMLAGMFILGFIYNSPLTLAYINKFLMGFWPQWQTHLYWYILIGGILFVYTIENKNPYCQWFCPFGAAQEVMGVVGGAKVYSPRQFRTLLSWIQRGLAWVAIILALLFRNPGMTSFEIFGSLFSLTGSNIQFVLLGLVLVASMFIKRPWCTYLCPLDPVTDFIKMMRKWIIELWQEKIMTSSAK